jgi:hypothetical protein
MKIRDLTNSSFPGAIQRHGCDHLRTSDKAVAESTGLISADGPTQDSPRIPPNKDFTEVSTIEAPGEACTAETADQGGPVGPGTVHQGDPATKSVGPVTARVRSGEVVKAAGVTSHPQLMRSHQAGSITHKDHKAVHCGPSEKCEKEPGPVTAHIDGRAMSSR